MESGSEEGRHRVTVPVGGVRGVHALLEAARGRAVPIGGNALSNRDTLADHALITHTAHGTTVTVGWNTHTLR